MFHFKKGFDNIREKLDDTKITDLIKQLKLKYSQEKMYKIFKISRATYYYNLNKTITKTQERYYITYIYTKDFGRTYLASFMDLYTNEIKGCDYFTAMITDIVLKALSKLNLNNDLAGCIIHIDQGLQYTSKDYTSKVKGFGATLSYSRKGNPYDNAPIESFHSVLKKELIYQSKDF